MNKLLLPLLLTITIGTLGIGAQPAFAVPVDLELQLLVDVSGSVDGAEFILQRDGWASAFTSAPVSAIINDASFGGMCVQLIYWSSSNQQSIAVNWFVVQTTTDAQNLANAIMAAARPFSGGTEPSFAINFGAPLFTNNGCEGQRLVIDVSGDGTGNAGATSTARNNALAAGITRLNGLVIGGSQTVFNFYVANIQGGPMSFTNTVANFAGFAQAAVDKLMTEIPPPTRTAVGGEFSPMTTSALLLAGSQNMLAWTIPLVVAAAGFGLVISRKL